MMTGSNNVFESLVRQLIAKRIDAIYNPQDSPWNIRSTACSSIMSSGCFLFLNHQRVSTRFLTTGPAKAGLRHTISKTIADHWPSNIRCYLQQPFSPSALCFLITDNPGIRATKGIRSILGEKYPLTSFEMDASACQHKVLGKDHSVDVPTHAVASLAFWDFAVGDDKNHRGHSAGGQTTGNCCCENHA